jgi:uncharacterized protein (DUF1800 family)
VDLILEQPATPRFIAGKLFAYFAHDKPSEEIIAQLARVLKDSNYELAPLLKTIFLSQEFYSDRAMGTQIKSPAQLVIGTIRTLEIKEPDAEGVARAMRPMNQDFFEPPNVKGWDGGETWINSVTLFARQNFASLLIGRGLEGTAARPAKPARGQGQPIGPLARGLDFVESLKDRKLDTPAAVVDHFAKALFLVPLTETRRSELIGFLGDLPPSAKWADQKREVNVKIGSLLILMMSMPEYQLT